MKAITLATIALTVLLVNAAPPQHPTQGKPSAPQHPGKQPITLNRGEAPVNQGPQHNLQNCPNDIKIDPDEDQGSDGPPPTKPKQEHAARSRPGGKQDIKQGPKRSGQQGPAAEKVDQVGERETPTVVGNGLFERSHGAGPEGEVEEGLSYGQAGHEVALHVDAALEARGFDPFAFVGTITDGIQGAVDGIAGGCEPKVTTVTATTTSVATVTENKVTTVTTTVVSVS